MAIAHAEMRIVREVLEGLVAPPLVTPILFEALADVPGGAPDGVEALLALVEGPLHAALEKRVGGGLADTAVARIGQLLTRPVSPRDRDATLEVQLTHDAVGVMIISAGTGLVQRLEAALGASRVAPFSVGALSVVRARLAGLGAPAIALCDAADFPSIDPHQLADALAASPPLIAHGIWGAELPFGRTLAARMEQLGARTVKFTREEGPEPLFDLIRSRRAGG